MSQVNYWWLTKKNNYLPTFILLIIYPSWKNQKNVIGNNRSGAERDLIGKFMRHFVSNTIFYFQFCRFNMTVVENITIIRASNLRMDSNYINFYINWFRTFFLGFVPFILLAVFNGRIIHKMRQSKQIMSNRVRVKCQSTLISCNWPIKQIKWFYVLIDCCEEMM